MKKPNLFMSIIFVVETVILVTIGVDTSDWFEGLMTYSQNELSIAMRVAFLAVFVALSFLACSLPFYKSAEHIRVKVLAGKGLLVFSFVVMGVFLALSDHQYYDEFTSFITWAGILIGAYLGLERLPDLDRCLSLSFKEALLFSTPLSFFAGALLIRIF